MADIRLITILPTQSVGGAQQTSSSGAGAQAGALSGIAPGTVLSGFVINRDATGNPVLRTENGDVTFSSNFFLKIGSEVTIRVENSSTGTLAHILTVDGQPPEIAEGQSGFAQAPEVIVSDTLIPQQQPTTANAGQTQTPEATQAAAPTQQGDTLPSAVTVTGTLISTPPTAPGATPPLPVGTQVTLNIAGLTAAQSSVPEEILQAATQNTAPAQTTTAFYSAYARAATTAPAAPLAAESVTAAPVVQPVVAPPAVAATETTVATEALPTTATPVIAAIPAETTPATTIAVPTANTAPPIPPNNSANTPVTAAINPPATTTTAVSTLIAPPAAHTSNTPQTTVAQPNTASAAAAPVVSPNLSVGQSVSATVIGSEPTGETLLQTPVGVVRLQPGTTLPAGSTVTLDVVQVTPPPDAPEAPGAVQAPPAPLTELARQWTALQQLFHVLSGEEAPAAVNTAPPGLPSVAVTTQAQATETPPQNISAGLMVFISALRSGDFRNWLGQTNTQYLEDTGHDALIRKAEVEFDMLARQFTTAEPQRWQPLFFPIAVGGELQQARLFVKRDRKQGSNQQGKRDEDTRFVVEVDLTQLGEMQMDGFVRKRDKEVQFDLMIRSLAPLPQEMQQDILRIYNDTGQLTGYKGSVAFQSVKEFPVNPMEEIIAHTINTLTA